ncbi:MAG: beta-N-acetylhexosaminidase [Gammaproteobacteria bacterium]|nr:beta-N-acetylhexosaminidase [Gammaproteobacteria bacterium]MDP2139198.1 beta-N-acetylhexosaminidase [Gammaproteobacteria bacterium]MDP2349033.1 beta-N-acetylhexosaminidase [Gammaproteobacteria bacterium]
MLDLQGHQLAPEERTLLRNPQVGGVILFARNYAAPQQLQELTAEIRACNPDILIAVDQEGGRVQRLRTGFTRLPPMLRFSQCWDEDPVLAIEQAMQCGWLMAVEVLAHGIDFSFAPVLDLDSGLSEVIGNRAFARDPQRVTALASAFMSGMHDAGMATTGKHFPGHGNVVADSHLDIPVDQRTLEQIRAQDLQPFERCVGLLDGVMPAHVIYEKVDPHCAGFSDFWLNTVLRGELGFDGVIFSDDLVMAGAAAAGGMEQRIDAALGAGCDMILVCNDRALALQALAHLEARAVPGNPRLRGMQRRRIWTPELLRNSEQWGRAHATVVALTGDTS